MPTLTQATTPETARPVSLSPTDGAPVEGSAAPLRWQAVPGATEYEIEVSDDAGFAAPRYRVTAGAATRLTLLEMLPEDGSTFYWRVRARTMGGWRAWSDAAAFTAVTEGHARSAGATAAARDATAEPEAGASQLREILEEPYKTEHTSARAVILFFSVLLLSFIVTFALIAYAVYGM